MICGWCHAETEPGRCSACGRDPALPWEQRGETPPTAEEWKRTLIRQRLAETRRQLGPDATDEAVAESLGVSSRTVRRMSAR